MNIFNYFKKNSSANEAKERLQIIISHERKSNKDRDFINKMRQDIVNVIKKYINIEEKQVSINVEKSEENENSNISILELNLTLGNGCK